LWNQNKASEVAKPSTAGKTLSQSKSSASGFSRLFGNTATSKKQPTTTLDKDASKSETTTRSPEVVAKTGSRSPGVTGSRSQWKKTSTSEISNKVSDVAASKGASNVRTKATQQKYVLINLCQITLMSMVVKRLFFLSH